jgi:hypothetical protein
MFHVAENSVISIFKVYAIWSILACKRGLYGITDASVSCTASTFTVEWLLYGNILCYAINKTDLQISNQKYIK